MAEFLDLIEASGEWPKELIQAYVTMIAKALGGTRPQDQRPSTVLDVVYGIWDKVVVLTWSPVLQTDYLGRAAMGFRAQSSTLHLAQLLTDLIELQSHRHKSLWLVSFDVEKCFPTLPWWAIFEVLSRAGVQLRLIQCFRRFLLAVAASLPLWTGWRF